MSADNGIYILRTKDKQYRVIYAHAIDNLYHSFLDPNNKKLVPTRLIEYFGSAKFTQNAETSHKIAYELAKNTYLEYGIQLILIDKTWEQIIKEAKQLAPLEIKAIKSRNQNGLWKSELEVLETIINM